MRFLRFLVVLLGVTCSAVSSAAADERVVILREGVSAELLDGTFTLKLLKIRGYNIDVRINDEKQKLKRGQTISPDGDCYVTFRKVSPETRIARFATNCER